jgi:hypothetical protein
MVSAKSGQKQIENHHVAIRDVDKNAFSFFLSGFRNGTKDPDLLDSGFRQRDASCC